MIFVLFEGFPSRGTALQQSPPTEVTEVCDYLFLETLATLDMCKDEIKSACTFSIDDSALAVLLQCGVDAKAFFDSVDKCFTNSTTDAEGCSCFDALDKDSKMYDKVVACKTKDANVAVLKEKKNCKKSGYQCIKI